MGETLALMRPLRTGPSRTDEPADFSALDEAIHLLHSEEEPWSVHLEVRVAGSLDASRLRAALAAAVDRHPRARARRSRRGRWIRRWAWETGPTPDPDALVEVVDCPDDETLGAVRAELQSRSVPLTGSSPLRLCLAHHPGGDVVMLNLDHAAGDGVAALRLLRSITRAYAGQPDPVVAGPGVTSTAFGRWSGWPTLAGELKEILAGPARVAPEGGDDAPGYGFHHVALTAEATRALIVGRPPDATVNDVLVAALHLAIAAWNDEHGAPADRIAVLMPVNLRPPQWWHEGVINASFMVPVSTRASERVDAPTAVAAVAERTGRVKQGRTAAAVVGLLTGLQRLPLPLKRLTARVLSRGRFVKTAILSNLGRQDDPPSFGPGGGEVVEMWFSPPAKMPLGLAIGALTVGGRLHLSFRYRHPLLGPAAATGFADGYLAALRSLAAHPEPTPATAGCGEPRHPHAPGTWRPSRPGGRRSASTRGDALSRRRVPVRHGTHASPAPHRSRRAPRGEPPLPAP